MRQILVDCARWTSASRASSSCFFGGMTEVEIARAQGTTSRTVRRHWQKARAFLYRELHADGPNAA